MTDIFIKNTLTKKKEKFQPLQEGRVSFYHCGPTVYWIQHIGNLRGMTCGDVVVRGLRYLGYEVTHVRNYTDVGHLTSDEDEGEDKIEKSARKEKKDPKEIADTYINKFEQDVAALNLEEPAYKPRATEHIQDMQDLVQTLLDKGYAYTTDLAVYFDVTKFPEYGELSGQKLEDKKAGAGTGEVSDEKKKHPQDFALWFFKAGVHQNALQTWESPFESSLVENGRGFPGWHIECSAMSKRYLGDTIDVHMGGIEHIPIHHTNEIAQSEAANGVKFVNYWLHNEHLLVNDNKMAKSEGTGVTLDDIKEQEFNPLALRYFFLQAHYRSKQNFTREALQAAENGLKHLYNQVRELGSEKGEVNQEFKQEFQKALADDFNMPAAMDVVQQMLKSDISKPDKLATVMDFDKVLGILPKTRESSFTTDIFLVKAIPGKKYTVYKAFEDELPEEVIEKIEKRQYFKKEKKFQEADNLREEIKKLGYAVEDSKDGPRVFKI